ncbi:hypothetical protein VE02_08859 [Pseudogymnoascus sp. 03VT05]|nr:hypothetical protein VE02_08859 [Pseudogymnoascus sp. 03VT05]
MVSVSMFPALIFFSSTLPKNRAGVAVVNIWFFTMIITGTLALFFAIDASGPPLSSNTEPACFLPDKTLLTSLTQPQDMATVIWGGPVDGAPGYWGIILCLILSTTMASLGTVLSFVGPERAFYERYMAVRDKAQMRPGWYGAESDKEGYELIIVVAIIGSVVWVPLVIMIEWSMRNVPVEENSNAVGQWGP